MEEEEDRCVTHKRREWGARPACARERQTEKKRLGRKQMTLNRWGIGGEGRREEIKERQKERGGAVEGYLLVFSLVLIPFCA